MKGDAPVGDASSPASAAAAFIESSCWNFDRNRSAADSLGGCRCMSLSVENNDDDLRLPGRAIIPPKLPVDVVVGMLVTFLDGMDVFVSIAVKAKDTSHNRHRYKVAPSIVVLDDNHLDDFCGCVGCLILFYGNLRDQQSLVGRLTERLLYRCTI